MFGKTCSCYYKIISSNILNELRIDFWRIQVYAAQINSSIILGVLIGAKNFNKFFLKGFDKMLRSGE